MKYTERDVLDLSSKENYNRSSYKYGSEVENQIREFLGESCFSSSTSENLYDDIDLWLGDLSISVKAQDTASKTGNFGFELKRFNTKTQQWDSSWFYTCNADVYVIKVRQTLYCVSTDTLRKYIDYTGWDTIKELSPKTLDNQRGRRYTNAKIGLLAVETAVSNRVAVELSLCPERAAQQIRESLDIPEW